MKITENHTEGFVLDGIKNANNDTNDVLSLTYNEMWQIFNYMQQVNIKQQIKSYLELRKDDQDYFYYFGRTTEDMLHDEELLYECIEDVNDGSYGDIDDDDICKLLERHA